MIQILGCSTCHLLVYSHFTQKTPLLTDLCGGVFQWQEPQPWTSQCPSPPPAFSTSSGCGSDSIVCLHSVQMINQLFNQPIREPAIQSQTHIIRWYSDRLCTYTLQQVYRTAWCMNEQDLIRDEKYTYAQTWEWLPVSHAVI